MVGESHTQKQRRALFLWVFRGAYEGGLLVLHTVPLIFSVLILQKNKMEEIRYEGFNSL